MSTPRRLVRRPRPVPAGGDVDGHPPRRARPLHRRVLWPAPVRADRRGAARRKLGATL